MIMQQAEDVVIGEPLPTLEKVKLNGEGQPGDVSPELSHQLHGRFHRPARGQQVVHQDNVLTRLDGVQVNFERVRPILQIVGDAGRRSRQLARLAHRNEAGVQTVGQRGTEDESTRLDSQHQIHILPDIVRSQRVNQLGKSLSVLEQGRDVVEQNPRLGKIRNGADQLLQRVAIDGGVLCRSLRPI